MIDRELFCGLRAIASAMVWATVTDGRRFAQCERYCGRPATIEICFATYCDECAMRERLEDMQPRKELRQAPTVRRLMRLAQGEP